jgi:flagellin-like hook-associated protein FlgL
MSGIIPIPTTRIGDLFARQRLTNQVQGDQLELFRIQNQISTGKRIQLPSEDAPSALRAINLQRLIGRKDQIRTNLKASEGFLAGADARLQSISTGLIELRGTVVGVAGNTVPESSRLAAMHSIDSLLQELVTAGNAKIHGRYLFAGSSSQSEPYSFEGKYVEFSGNNGALRSYVDIERLFETNLTADEVFGAVSVAVEGGRDVSPHLTADTLVSSLNGGAGIGANPAITVSINNGSTTDSRVIDLRAAVTVGDVARLIEDNAPGSIDVTAEVTGSGLVLRVASGTITVSEAAEGRAARMLGIFSDPDLLPTGTITGLDLNPALLKTTQLENLLGSKSQGFIRPVGANNDIRLTAAANGVNFNGLDVVFVGGGVAGAETASYDSGTNTLTVTIEEDRSVASDIAEAITAEGTFTAAADYHDATATHQIGTESIPLGTFANITSGGSGEVLDTASGLILTNGNESVTLDISSAETVEDLLNLINGSDLGLIAEINAAANGINVRSRLSGADFTIGENGGTTATQLGIRSYTGETKLSALNRGLGVPTTVDNEQLDTSKLDSLRIVARNGVEFDVDLSTATSLQDIAQLINDDPLNFGNTAVLARVTANGNGIEFVDSSLDLSGDITNDLQILVVGGTQAAEYLGFVAPGGTQQASHTTDDDGYYTMSGKNVLGHDMMIEARDGTQVWIDLGGAATIQDVIDRINNDPENGAPPAVQARLAATGNGIELVDSTVGAGSLSVNAVVGSKAAIYLGFVEDGQTQTSSATGVLQSEDRHTLETDSVFNTLIRLRTALENNDVAEIGRSLERLDDDINRVTFARAEIGSRIQNLNVISVRIEDENVQLKSALSTEIDVDLIEAISQLTARQFAFEASLRSAASLMQLSLLNFL